MIASGSLILYILTNEIILFSISSAVLGGTMETGKSLVLSKKKWNQAFELIFRWEVFPPLVQLFLKIPWDVLLNQFNEF